MSSTGSSEFIRCAVHKEHATAICLKHKFLLCTECLLGNVHIKPDCEPKTIKGLNNRYKSTLIGFLELQQGLAESREKFQGVIDGIRDKGGDIKNEITAFHDELVNRLGEFKDAALRSLKTAVESAVSPREESLAKMKDVEAMLADKIDTLQDEKLNEASEELKQYKLVLSEADRKGEVVDASFQRSTRLETILTVVKDIGQIGFVVQDYYEDVGTPTAANLKIHKGSEIIISPDKTIEPKDEDAPTVPPRRRNDETNEQERFQDAGCKSPENVTGAKPKGAKKNGGPFTEGSNKKNSSKTTKAVELKTLKNKTFTISPVNEARSFEKIMLFDQDKLVMLDKTQKEVTIVSTEGVEIARKRLVHAPLDFILTGSGEIIVLVSNNKNEVKLCLVEFADGELKQTNTSTQKNIALPVLGIDYKKNKNTDVFAITGNGTVTILEATEGASSGNFKLTNTKIFRPSEGDLSKALAIYDFPTDSVFLLNAIRKTMKCYLFGKDEMAWAKRLSDEDVEPKTMTKGRDYIHLACSNLIVKIGVKDGQQCKRSSLNLSDTFTNVTGICVEEKYKVAIVVGDTKDGSQLAFVGL